jgi:hypothetical protein
MRWIFKTRSSRTGEESRQSVNEIDLGNENQFNGQVGDIATGNINKSHNHPTPQTSKKTGRISFGRKNKFKGSIGDVSTGDITKDEYK